MNDIENINGTKVKKVLKSKENLKSLIIDLEKNLKKKFTKIDIQNILEFLDTINYIEIYKLYKLDIKKINDYIINIYKGELNKLKPIDIHEYLNDEIYERPSKLKSEYSMKTPKKSDKKDESGKKTDTKTSTSVSSSTSSSASSSANTSNMKELLDVLPKLKSKTEQIEFTKILNYESLWRDANILVDSRYQNIANPDRSKLVFSLVNNTKTKIPGTGVITILGNMRDIVEIEIYPFSIPYMSLADNYYKKITLSILELSSISVDAYEDSQFHFMFTCKQSGNLLELTPINKVFRFYKPITRLNEFSIRFGAPLTPIIFEKDRLNTLSIDYTTNPGVINFAESHNLITGDLIYITSFETKNNAQDLNIINEINNKNGHICTRLSNSSISINVDFTQIIPANRPLAINNYPNSSNPQDLSVSIYFGSKRILMPLRIRYLQGSLD
jgi:hypothetical protein